MRQSTYSSVTPRLLRDRYPASAPLEPVGGSCLYEANVEVLLRSECPGLVHAVWADVTVEFAQRSPRLGLCFFFVWAFAILSFQTWAQTPQNLVQNGGFEAGDWSGWTTTIADSDYTLIGQGLPHSGRFSAFFGAVSKPDYISQSLATSAGQTYALSLWLWSGDNQGGTPIG